MILNGFLAPPIRSSLHMPHNGIVFNWTFDPQSII